MLDDEILEKQKSPVAAQKKKIKQISGSSTLPGREQRSQRVLIGVLRAAVEQTPRRPYSNSIFGHRHTQIQRHLHTQ